MSVIVIDGPEKAGKTSTIRCLHELLLTETKQVDIIKWNGAAEPDDRIYMSRLMLDVVKPKEERIAIWDRSWVSEYVYGRLLLQSRRLASDPWLGEWLYGRAADSHGLKVILPGPSPDILESRRDKTDLDVDPVAEQRLYTAYGKRFGWNIVEHAPSPEEEAVRVFNLFKRKSERFHNVSPAIFSGSLDTRKIVLATNDIAELSLARFLGDDAFKYGWVQVSRSQMDLNFVLKSIQRATDIYTSNGTLINTCRIVKGEGKGKLYKVSALPRATWRLIY